MENRTGIGVWINIMSEVDVINFLIDINARFYSFLLIIRKKSVFTIRNVENSNHSFHSTFGCERNS